MPYYFKLDIPESLRYRYSLWESKKCKRKKYAKIKQKQFRVCTGQDSGKIQLIVKWQKYKWPQKQTPMSQTNLKTNNLKGNNPNVRGKDIQAIFNSKVLLFDYKKILPFELNFPLFSGGIVLKISSQRSKLRILVKKQPYSMSEWPSLAEMLIFPQIFDVCDFIILYSFLLCVKYWHFILLSRFMSLQKFKKGSSEQLTLLKSKLFTVDTHIRRSENLPATLFMHPELIQFLTRQPQIVQITNQIVLKKSKSYLFSDTSVVRFFFNALPISEDRRFVLKIQPSKAQLEVLVSLDGQKKVGYLVKDAKGILINETGWKKAQFTIIAKKKEKLSTAKIEIDTIIIEHKTKIFGIASQKKQIQKQMKEFLKNNLTKQKIAAIVEKRRRKSLLSGLKRGQTFSAQSNARSIESHENSRLFRSTSGFNESTSIIKNRSPISRSPKIQTTQMKRDLQYFEESKQKYLKHINKMEPEVGEQIMEGKNKYLQQKYKTLQNISTIVSSVVFMRKILILCRNVSKQKCRKAQAYLLCKRFYRNLAHANKIRMTFRTRNKVCMDLNLGVISCCLFKESKRKAEEKIISKFKTQLYKWDLQKIVTKCEQYHKCAIKIQRKFRLDNGFYRLRFETMTKKIKNYTFSSQQQFEQIFKKYKEYCYTKSKMLKFGFTKFHKHIDQLMRQKALKQIRL